jgi:plasmid stability protein
MSDLLVRNVKPETLQTLKAEAGRNGRSVQAEASRILDEAAERLHRTAAFWEEADQIFESLKGRPQSDSTLAIREDRDSDYGHDA